MWLLLLACAPWVVDEIDESCPIEVGDELEIDRHDGGATLYFADQPPYECAKDGHDFACEQTVESDLSAFDADAVLYSWIRMSFTRGHGELTGEIRIDTRCGGEDCDALEWPPCGVGDEPSPFHASR